MISLFFDTSSPRLIVYLIKDGKILYEKNILTKYDHSSYLVPSISEAFKNNNIDINELDNIFVGIGPGSFTGTRISVTDAKVLAMCLNVNLIPISSLQEFIYAVDNYDYYVPIIEEKNDNIYYAIFDKDKNRIMNDSYSNVDTLYKILDNYDGKIALITDRKDYKYETVGKKIDIIKMVDCLKNEKGINPHLLKPSYIKKISVEEKI